MICAASTITVPTTYVSVAIYILHLCLLFITYLTKSARKLVTWQKQTFIEAVKYKFPDFCPGTVLYLMVLSSMLVMPHSPRIF